MRDAVFGSFCYIWVLTVGECSTSLKWTIFMIVMDLMAHCRLSLYRKSLMFHRKNNRLWVWNILKESNYWQILHFQVFNLISWLNCSEIVNTSMFIQMHFQTFIWLSSSPKAYQVIIITQSPFWAHYSSCSH